MLVEIPDCSRYFLGSVVSYSNTSKQQILGVTAKEVVSEECARQMASGALKQFGSTHALSVTGVAGPGGTKVGMVCFALATEKEVVSKTANFGGTRGEVIAQAKEEMLYYLWNYVSTNR
ncbi:MAG: CinA-like protein [Chlamydiales bacterium]|nr:CinA-like protein [Chlamydiales bacterium]MCH9622509.1 CinA-like protein [Chlamydiales bacterium]